MRPYFRGKFWWVRVPRRLGGGAFSLGVAGKPQATALARFLAWVADHHPTAFPTVRAHLAPAFAAYGAGTFSGWLAHQQAEDANPSLCAFVPDWLAYLERRGTPNAKVRAYYAGKVRAFCEAHPVRKHSFTRSVVLAWLHSLPLSRTNRARTALSSFAAYLVMTDRLDHNPVLGVPASREAEPRTRHLTQAEAQQLVQSLPNGPERAFHALAMATAGDRGTLLAMRWQDVNPAQQTVTLHGTKAQKRARTVPILPRWAWAWQDFLGWASQQGFLPTARVFATTTPYRLARALDGIADYSIRDHRHTWAVQAVRDGVPYFLIAEGLGHGSTVLAQRVYGRFAPTAADWHVHQRDTTPLPHTAPKLAHGS